MSLTEQVDRWRDPTHWDDAQPTEEQVIDQFLFSAISDFLEDELENIETMPDFDQIGERIVKWVREYGQRVIE